MLIQDLCLYVGFCDIVIEEKKKVVEEAKKLGTSYIFWVDWFKLTQKNTANIVCWEEK